MSGASPITIVTPVFNGAAWIGETLESVVAQDYSGESEHRAGRWLDRRHPRCVGPYAERGVRIVSHTNMGEARTVNRGAAMASHDLFAVVNADDPVLPGWASGMAEAFVADPDLSAAYPDWRRIDARGQLLDEVRTEEFDYTVLFAQHFCLVGPGAVLRLSHLRGAPVRDPARGTSSDYDLWLRLALHGHMRRVPRVLATWRRHVGGTSSAGRGRAMAGQDWHHSGSAFTCRSAAGRARTGAHGIERGLFERCTVGFARAGNSGAALCRVVLLAQADLARRVVRQQRRSIPSGLCCRATCFRLAARGDVPPVATTVQALGPSCRKLQARRCLKSRLSFPRSTGLRQFCARSGACFRKPIPISNYW